MCSQCKTVVFLPLRGEKQIKPTKRNYFFSQIDYKGGNRWNNYT